jgi:DTW domain-containing protein YfiP
LNVETYQKRREELLQESPTYRNLCTACLQPEFGCYCRHVQKFDAQIKFMILIHPIEAKRRIATGRMSHLVLKDSELIVGQDYSKNGQVNKVLSDPQFQSVVLYPGRNSLNLTTSSPAEKLQLFTPEKKLAIFVIDGTWATARKTMRQSQNLSQLPRISFTPPEKSQFRVRKQPGVDCYSTIEAIHHTIDLVGSQVGFDSSTREHDKLLYVFNKMVERQLEFIRQAYDNPKISSYRRPRTRVA